MYTCANCHAAATSGPYSGRSWTLHDRRTAAPGRSRGRSEGMSHRLEQGETKPMTIANKLLCATALAAMLAAPAAGVLARDVTISVWAGGTSPNDIYRVDALDIAADLLEREWSIANPDEPLNLTIEKTPYNGWDDFKQALTLSAEAGTAPDIVVSGHEDIAPWSQSGLIVPVEDYVDFDAWPLSDIYPNLIEIASYGGVVYGIPQDAES